MYNMADFRAEHISLKFSGIPFLSITILTKGESPPAHGSTVVVVL